MSKKLVEIVEAWFDCWDTDTEKVDDNKMDRKLDGAIAKALGAKVEERNGEYWYCGRVPYRVEHFSADGEAMLMLIEEMRKRGWNWEINMRLNHDAFAECYKTDYDYTFAAATEPPKAIALAAIYALTGEEWVE